MKLADDCVCAEVKDGKMYCANYSIVTFSTGVLQAAIRGDQNSVKFEPPLPRWKQDAINHITPIVYGKIFLVFPTTFWNEIDGDQQLLGYVADEKGYYGHYILDKNRPNTITVDVSGNLAIKIATQSQEETVNEVMAILRKIFNNVTLPEPESVVISRWHLDPLFLHSYSDYGPGVPESVFDDLLKPVNGRLYFAGEALNSSNYGNVQGAYGTGVYAAQQITGTSNSAGVPQATLVCVFVAGVLSLLSVVQ
ncbi:Polyamine oxidase 1 [Geodia barretti]|uniref:Polyamine oxidase 1 n=1 Tax=Geodia barretti TaxID=519541 RepID=A0AA35REX1_GEOBA|nr:Polyamine oxidase 1 [Geodia barretti]